MKNKRELLEDLLKGMINPEEVRVFLNNYSLKATEVFPNVFKAEIRKNGILEETRKMNIGELENFKKRCIKWIVLGKNNEWINLIHRQTDIGAQKNINVTLNID